MSGAVLLSGRFHRSSVGRGRTETAIQENLNKKEEENLDLKDRLYEELAANAKVRQENDILSGQNKVLDGQVQSLRQQVQEASIYKQRLEQQVGLLKQQMEQTMAKTSELQDQLDIEQEANKKLTEQISVEQRQCRRMERELEDEQHMRKEMENERNLLREKLSRLEKQELTLIEERRNLQKQLNDLSLNHRAAQIELQRKAEHLERTEKNLQTLQENHQELQDAHRAMGVEVDHLREDVARMDDQLHRETTLRKSLQEEKKTLMAQVQNLVVQLETTRLAVDSTQRELVDVTDHKVRLEGILRDTKSAMQKVTLEQQIEQKSHAQRTAMLEKVISDERAERRNLVNETLEVNSQRADTLDCLRRAQNEITEIKRQRLEYEEEIERQKGLANVSYKLINSPASSPFPSDLGTFGNFWGGIPAVREAKVAMTSYLQLLHQMCRFGFWTPETDPVVPPIPAEKGLVRNCVLPGPKDQPLASATIWIHWGHLERTSVESRHPKKEHQVTKTGDTLGVPGYWRPALVAGDRSPRADSCRGSQPKSSASPSNW
ncbi:Hypothetical protein SCF082_LOCUS36439 [Durusdinium trenchii]|uniref:Cilia- and flagella-associated protein 157 n=1 Tax=Durusdinium trenchii TaxID=1381693 RepID=A0ABP0PG56_9DINO